MDQGMRCPSWPTSKEAPLFLHSVIIDYKPMLLTLLLSHNQ
jgi:hypothetical protein